MILGGPHGDDRPDPRTRQTLANPVLGYAQGKRLNLSVQQYTWLGITLLIIAALLRWLGPVLTPFLIAAILAYIGKPAVTWAEQRRVPRTLSTTLVLALTGAVLFGLLLVLTPLVHSEFSQLLKRLPQLLALLHDKVAPWLEQQFGIELQLDVASIKQYLSENAQSAQEMSLKVLKSIRSGGTIVLEILINLALIPVVMFYLLRDWNIIAWRVEELTPRRWLPLVRTMAVEIDDVLAEFLRGQASVMAVLAIYYVTALWLAGLQFALPIGILTGLLVFIPYVGFGLGLMLGMIAALLQWTDWPAFAAVAAVYGIGQLLENYVLVPWLVGDRIGLHPLAVIFALLAFGQLFGFAGVLLALPASAVLLVLLRHLRAMYRESAFYR